MVLSCQRSFVVGKMPIATCKIDQLSDDALQSVRVVSRALWKGQYRLEIGCRIAEAPGGRVFGHGLAKASGLSDKAVGEELRRLESAGILLLAPCDDPGQKRVYFDRVESCYWAGVLALIDEIVERAALEVAQATPLRSA